MNPPIQAVTCVAATMTHSHTHLLQQAAVKRLLSDSEEVVAEDVGPLLKAVVATNKFEREMAALFGGAKGLREEDEEDSGLQVCQWALMRWGGVQWGGCCMGGGGLGGVEWGVDAG